MNIEDLLNNLHDAYFNYSFENGVAWLNKIEHEDFVKKYPSLHKAIVELMKYRNEREE